MAATVIDFQQGRDYFARRRAENQAARETRRLPDPVVFKSFMSLPKEEALARLEPAFFHAEGLFTQLTNLGIDKLDPTLVPLALAMRDKLDGLRKTVTGELPEDEPTPPMAA